jgi:hypothetical protein
MRKRFEISKPYEGPPLEAPWGGTAEDMYESVEEYDDEFTARVRVAILNEGLAQKKYRLHQCIDPENEIWEEIEDTND